MNVISIPPIVMATLMFYVGFYHFLIYRRQKDNRENLTFAFSCFSVGLYAICCSGLYNASSPEVGVEWQRLQFITLELLAIALLWFIVDYTKISNRKILLGFTVYFIFAALTQLLIRGDLTWTNEVSIKQIQLPFGYDIIYNEMTPGVLTNFHSMVGLFYFLYILSVSLKFYTSGNKEKGMPLLIAMAILGAGLINDTLMNSGFYDFIYMLEYSYIGIILVVTFFLTNNVIKAGEIKIALLNEKKFSEHIINSMPGIFFLYQYKNDTFNLKKWNINTQAILGFTKKELKQGKMESFFSEDHIHHLDDVASQTLNQGSVKTELEIRAKDDSLIPFYINARLFKNAGDTFIIGTGIDITEQKHFEKENQKLQTQLVQTQKMEAIGTLAGGIAHDFNNILSGMFGFSYLAKKHIKNTERAGDYIDQLTKGAQKATELVQQILMFSRKSKPEKYPLKISLIIKEALKLLRSSIPATITIKDNIVSEATVLADPTQIHQIIMNLCTNAYHAMRETGGILAVSLKEIEISDKDTNPGVSMLPGNYLKMEVSDDGHGMDSKTLVKIFEPYFTTKKIGQGTGLGLSVVIGIIEEHNGFIKAYSEKGQGTTFHVYLPIVDREAVSYTLQKEKEVLTGGTERILVVDDDAVILTVTQTILKDYGYKVNPFTNGVKALEAYTKDPNGFDLIITDMTMPGMTGLELSKKVLELKPHQPIILCTGHSELINKKKAIAMGISEYFEKPMIAKKIIKVIRTVIDKQKSTR